MSMKHERVFERKESGWMMGRAWDEEEKLERCQLKSVSSQLASREITHKLGMVGSRQKASNAKAE
jgi:hypothetical protein